MGIKLSGYVNVYYTKTEYDDDDESGQGKPVSKELVEQLDASDFSLEEGGESERDKEDGSWSCEALFKAFGDGYQLIYILSFVGDQPHVKKLEGQPTGEGISEVKPQSFLSAVHEIPEDDE